MTSILFESTETKNTTYKNSETARFQIALFLIIHWWVSSARQFPQTIDQGIIFCSIGITQMRKLKKYN